MILTWLIPAALLTVAPEPAPPLAPARARDRMPLPKAPPPLGPPIEVEKWKYPGMFQIGGSRSRGSNTLDVLETASLAARTEDDFEKVAAFYRELAGTTGLGPASGGTADALVVNDSQARPVKMTTISRWFQGGSITVTISRAENEKWTHIALVYRSMRKAF